MKTIIQVRLGGVFGLALCGACSDPSRPAIYDTADAASLAAAADAPTARDAQYYSDLGACGEEGLRCCGIRCAEGLSCSASLCVRLAAPCGGAGQACCIGPSGNPSCARDHVCAQGACRPCGAPGSICCDRDATAPCAAGHLCAAGVCAPTPTDCGNLGQACCGGTTCTAGARCLMGSCQMAATCGDRGLPCCASSIPCQGGTCIGGMCTRPPPGCGRSGLPCCDGQCSALYVCREGVCQAREPGCGDLGQPCCPNSVDGCGGALLCLGGMCHPRPTCGVEGLRCCGEQEAPMSCAPRFRCASGTCRQ